MGQRHPIQLVPKVGGRASANATENAAHRNTMANYPPTCANTTSTQGMNMANSIANLRLKAKEYSLNQVPTVN
ncbi:hypothetical protein SRHO_G00070100 [Serrasalmus rhombeus]